MRDTFEPSLWVEASRDVESDERQARLAYAKVGVLPVWPFLANAKSRTEYLHREALAEDRIVAAAGEDPALVIELKKALRQDFSTLHKARLATVQKAAALKCDHCGSSPKSDGNSWNDAAEGDSCFNCKQGTYKKTAKQGAKAANKQKPILRRLAIVVVAADDDEDDESAGDDSGSGDAYYVVDEDSGKDIGGPYDSQDAAQDAISGGDFDEPGGDLTVQEGPEDGSGSDSDDDDDSESDSDSDADQPDDSDSDDDSDDEDDNESEDGDSDSDDDDKPAFLKDSMRKGAPFAGYDDFDDCVEENKDKDDPDAYCGEIKHKVEDGKESKKIVAVKCTNCTNGNHTGTNGAPGCKGGNCTCSCKKESRKTALEEGEDPIAWVEQWVDSGMGTAEKEDEHDETSAVSA